MNNLTPEQRIAVLANEAFLRRAAELDFPFMLKGSYVTRQYLPDPMMRIANDIDWTYFGKVHDAEDARTKFDAWATAVTELFVNDGTTFTSFKENAFWRSIDYAMNDDFPTVSTDLVCQVENEEYQIYAMDVSFNLDIEPGPVPLLYRPLQGEPFMLPYTCPLSLQVAWKLHQCLVRPRYKDFFDITLLLNHNAFTPNMLHDCLQALVNECHVDKVDIMQLELYISDNMAQYISRLENEKGRDWQKTSGSGFFKKLQDVYLDDAKYITPDQLQLLKPFSQVLREFSEALQRAGFSSTNLRAQLPQPNRKSRKTYGK